MTATDELRHMLDERGVKWIEGNDPDTTAWFDGSYVVRADEYKGRLLVERVMTPKQALAATLGRGECRFISEGNYDEAEGRDEYSWFKCGACGWVFDDCDRWLMTMSYCPNCGRKVVDG